MNLMKILKGKKKKKIRDVAYTVHTPEVKEVQGCHCFQHSKLFDQQLEDCHNPVHTSVDFQHVSFVSHLPREMVERFSCFQK